MSINLSPMSQFKIKSTAVLKKSLNKSNYENMKIVEEAP
jgi:hypothetical protein